MPNHVAKTTIEAEVGPDGVLGPWRVVAVDDGHEPADRLPDKVALVLADDLSSNPLANRVIGAGVWQD